MGGMQLTFLPIAPLMHGATQWAVMGQSFTGNRVVLVPRFEPHEVWRLVQDEKVNVLMITGDAMGRPLIEALEQEPSRSYDLSSLFSLSSTAAVFSPSVKDQFLDRFPDLMLTDSMGASESGATGITRVLKGATAMKSGPTVSPVSARWSSPTTARSSNRLRRGRQGRAVGLDPPGLLQRPGEDR